MQRNEENKVKIEMYKQFKAQQAFELEMMGQDFVATGGRTDLPMYINPRTKLLQPI